MSILEITDQIRKKAFEHKQYQNVADQSGVNYGWLCKFAAGEITNPTVKNIHKLEVFFTRDEEK